MRKIKENLIKSFLFFTVMLMAMNVFANADHIKLGYKKYLVKNENGGYLCVKSNGKVIKVDDVFLCGHVVRPVYGIEVNYLVFEADKNGNFPYYVSMSYRYYINMGGDFAVIQISKKTKEQMARDQQKLSDANELVHNQTIFSNDISGEEVSWEYTLGEFVGYPIYYATLPIKAVIQKFDREFSILTL